MTLKGDLGSMDLTHVSQMLSMNQKEGLLRIYQEGDARKRFILFTRKGITAYPVRGFDDPEVLAHILRRKNLMGRDVEAARKRFERPDKPLYQALLEMGLVDEDEARALIRDRVAEDLYEFFFLKNARFEFQESDPASIVPAGAPDALFLPIESVVMEANRRLDEWESIRELVPSFEEIFKLSSPAARGPLGRAAEGNGDRALVIDLLDGNRNLNEVVVASGLSRFRVCRVMQLLVREGIAVPLSLRELEEKAQYFYKQNRLDEAVKLFRRILVLRRDNSETHLRLAMIHERRGEAMDAAAHLRVYSEHLLKENQPQKALEALEKAVTLLPTDTGLLSALVDLQIRHAKQLKPVAAKSSEAARHLVAILLELGEADKAEEMLRRLLAADLDRPRFQGLLIQHYVKQGAVGKACAEYEKMAERCLVEKSHAGAARLYRRILSLDPSRHDIQEILDCVDEDRRKALRRLRRRRAGMRVVAYCLLFIGFYVYYERQAAYALDTIDVSYLLKEGDYDEASRQYESFIKRYPLSLSAVRAHEAIGGLDGIRTERTRERQAEERRREEQIAAEQKRAEKTYRDAHQALHRDDLEAALDLFRQTRDAAPRREWVTREDLTGKIENLERYLREAEATWRKARELEGQGQVEQAHIQFRALQKEFARAAVARDLRFPVRVVSHPPGAAVLSEEGARLGQTPLVLRAPAGRIVWRFEHEGYEPLAAAVAPEADGVVEVALARSPAWQFETPVVLVSEPALSAGVLYAGGRDGKLHALQLSQRRLLWSYEFQGLTDVTSTPVLWRGLLFLVAGDGQVHCLDPLDQGRALWRRPVEGLGRGAPVPSGDLVLVAGTGGRVSALATTTGEPRWQQAVEAAPGLAPVSDGDRFFVGTRGGLVLALRVSDGGEAGRFQAGPGAVTGLLLAAPDRLAVVTESGRVVLLQLPQCVPAWETKVPAGVPVPPVVSHGRLVVAGRDGGLTAFDLESGREMARSGPDGPPSGPPRVIGGAIYVVTVPGALRVHEGTTLELLWGRELPGAPDARVIGGPEHVILLGTGRKLFGYHQEH